MGSCTLQLQLAKHLLIQTFKYLDEEPTMHDFESLFSNIVSSSTECFWEYEL